MTIERVRRNMWDELLQVWEASALATHHFLRDGDFEYYREIIVSDYLDNLQLYCIKDDKGMAAFIGMSDDNIDLLFVRPDAMGRGYGSQLVEFALSKGVFKVDVNAENGHALFFYITMGYKISGSGEVDGYPLIYMEYGGPQIWHSLN